MVFSTQAALFAQDKDFDLLQAVFNENDKEAFQLLKGGADPNTVTAEGISPLMYAADKGNLYLCKILIQNGARINIKPANGTSALHAAVKNNHTEVALFLLENKANPNIQDENQRTPLHYACAYGYPRAADILLYYGANANIRDIINRPLMITAYYGDSIMTDLLLRYGADVNLAGFFKDTPLIVASQQNQLKIAKMLHKAGADVNLRNNSNLSALDMAVYKGHKEMTEYLLSIGAEPSSNITDGISTYELAKIEGHYEIGKLIKTGKTTHAFTDGKFSAGLQQNTNFRDYLIGLEAGFHQTAYNTELFAGWQNRPFRKKVLIPESEHLFFQYKEYRSGFYAGLHKNFALKQKSFSEFGVFAGGTGSLYLTNYKGSRIKSQEYSFVPQAGIYWYGHSAGLKAGYEYSPFEYDNNFPHRFNLTLKIFINKQFRYTEKAMDY
jgi:ankyrin repeat protein